jgi:sugar phosphate isomerase/epimerase
LPTVDLSDPNTTSLAPTLAPLQTEPRAAFDRLHAMGFRHVQLSATQRGMRPRELDRSARRDLAAMLRRREMSIAGVDAWIPPRHFLDDAHSDRAVAAAIDAISFAADLGRCPVSFTLPAGKNEEERAALAPVIEALVARASHLGVILADHAVPVTERDGVQIGIDPAAWLAAGEDPTAAATRHAPSIACVRLCDLLLSGMRGPINDDEEGRLDVTAYRVAVSLCELAQPVVIDTRQWRDPWSGLERTKDTWERAV